MPYESLVSYVHVSTLVGNTIIVDRVYRSCEVTIGGLDTRVDLLLLSVVDFVVILGMDWLSPCHAVLDYHAKPVTLAMPGLPQIEWRGSLDYVPSRVISYLKAQPAGMPPDRDIDFGIDMVPGTQPISIPPYLMAPTELKELKEKLQELPDKGQLNKVTIKNKYPLPRIEDLFD
ncbi:uncharacterized protein [Nicotiana tomentosiformis]|uniref:uncharacterized protein n=1 Tax=Nicotiana tomentosiformis TaxID=4098 RepID=UPI00388CAEBB